MMELSSWHKDTRDVFLIVASRLRDRREIPLNFLDGIRPFERARICGGLRDLIAMDILETRWDGELRICAGETFDRALRSADIPSRPIDLAHLKSPRR
ncbi:hypothetical protein CTAYLR_007485 [Chrysophaeum taylorii]|uniref:Uncharacterized protein n=1 Tax=Chrysophaeum taylorii TaxID=2483200 RepID=A0AAD7UBM5_9STRA|nr:hypothetical protein CTAYLR_007485 [Chrysophaeum taylorii]